MQMHQIMLDYFGSGISGDQMCEWGIEWDLCASSILPKAVASVPPENTATNWVK
jgi:hypothetical protein